MSTNYRVEWTAIAEDDLKRIINYIADDNPGNALQILKKTRQKAASLCTVPERCRIVPELQGQGIDTYRELIVDKWKIIYRTSYTIVYVLSVIDARRNVEDILLYRLIK